MSIQTSKTNFKELLHEKMQDSFMRKSIANAQERISENREKMIADLGNFEEWRTQAQEIRDHMLNNLAYYLKELSINVEKNGGNVFFAKTKEEAQEYIVKTCKNKKAKKVVKSKSMVSEEIDINHQLLKENIEVIETDLAEYILQIDDWNPPSHIVVPALHKNRDQIKEIFHKLGYNGSNNPEELTRFARKQIRKDFLSADVGITGCNFALAKNGAISIISNEGNVGMVTSLPKTHIAIMGMERILPSIKELDIFASLLCRSAVGSRLTSYIDILAGPRKSKQTDGPQDFHLVIIDNGRSNILASKFKDVLRCIRCGACANICPAYRQIGGQSYGSIYSGPIGVVISPLLDGYDNFGELPYASTLCGACDSVCPVKIPLSKLILEHRKEIVKRKLSPFSENFIATSFSIASSNMPIWKTLRYTAKLFSNKTKLLNNTKLPVLKEWTKSRNLPQIDNSNFRQWLKERTKNNEQK